MGKRGGRTIKLKEIVDAAVADCPLVKKVFVFKRTGEAGAARRGKRHDSSAGVERG